MLELRTEFTVFRRGDPPWSPEVVRTRVIPHTALWVDMEWTRAESPGAISSVATNSACARGWQA